MKKTIVLIAGLAIAGLLLKSCSIHPQAWTPLPKPLFSGTTALNEKLSSVEKISLQGWYGPEDIVMDKEGTLSCGLPRAATQCSDGRI